MIDIGHVSPATTYRRGCGPRGLRQRFWCPRGCVPAQIASDMHHLPWAFHVTLTAPPGKFSAALRRAQLCWSRRRDRVERAHPEWEPFWLMTLVSHAPFPFSDVHAHLLLGNVSGEDVDRQLAKWPYSGPGVKCVRITPGRGGAWGILHYVCSQVEPLYPGGPPAKWRHREDKGSYCPSLLVPPFMSDNLERLAEAYRAQLRRQRTTSAVAIINGRSPAWRQERARKAAEARWDAVRAARALPHAVR